MEALVETIKVRVPKGTRGVLEGVAEERHLELSDIVREALRDYTKKQQQAEKSDAEKHEVAS